jgi:hypothetical protein
MFLLLAASMPETSAEFRARYGKPEVERFAVRDGLTLAVEYGPDGEACRMRIEPRHELQDFTKSEKEARMDELTAVLDEVIPPEKRGKGLGPGEKIWGACAFAPPTTEYERVTLIHNFGYCQKPFGIRSLDAVLKNPSCQSLLPYAEKH